jgi:hypothetical protein
MLRGDEVAHGDLRSFGDHNRRGVDTGDRHGDVESLVVALERVNVVAVNGEDPIRSWHLQHQVGVMRDGHEPS